jgi:hypothetical protein
LRAALVSNVRRARSANQKVSEECASPADREWSTAPQATSFILSVRWSIDGDNMIFRLAAWTAEGDRF